MFRTTRGFAVLSVIGVLAILALIAVAIQATAPDVSRSQPAAVPLAGQAGINDIGKEGATKKADAKLEGDARCNAPIEVKKNKKAKGSPDGASGVESVCVKGCQYKITSGIPTKVAAKDSCKDIADAASKKKCETEKSCEVLQCGGPGGACSAVGGGSDKKKDELLGKAALVPSYFKDDPEIRKLLEDAKKDPVAAQAAVGRLDPWMQAAFDEARTEEQAKNDEKRASNLAIIQALGEEDAESRRLAEENRRLEEANENLRKIDLTKLADEQQQLAHQGPCPYGGEMAADGSCPPKPDPVPVPKPDPRKTPTCTGSLCDVRPPDAAARPPTNAGNGGTQNTGSGGMGSLGSLLSSLGKALGGATGGQTAQTAPAPTCSTDQNVYAQQQQQYQQALQQYNYQLQQYNYQIQLNAYYGGSAPTPPAPVAPSPCVPASSNQCTSQPQQPDASSCSVGSWRATYSGACIVGWQCIPSSAGAPTASLSCEPKVADVGMTLAISYSCSSGVASSTSFTVTTQPSGSATTTVKTPPAGTNTATYTLSCTDQGKTSGAECSVQVGRPSIILVANPKTVASNGISLLGWLTTGMQACTISSPDQADFTTRNAPNTSVNGTATSSPITGATRFLLHCETISGSTKDATTTVTVQ